MDINSIESKWKIKNHVIWMNMKNAGGHLLITPLKAAILFIVFFVFTPNHTTNHTKHCSRATFRSIAVYAVVVVIVISRRCIANRPAKCGTHTFATLALLLALFLRLSFSLSAQCVLDCVNEFLRWRGESVERYHWLIYI